MIISTHKIKFRPKSQILVNISNVEIHTFWGPGEFNETTNSIGSKLCNGASLLFVCK